MTSCFEDPPLDSWSGKHLEAGAEPGPYRTNPARDERGNPKPRVAGRPANKRRPAPGDPTRPLPPSPTRPDPCSPVEGPHSPHRKPLCGRDCSAPSSRNCGFWCGDRPREGAHLDLLSSFTVFLSFPCAIWSILVKNWHCEDHFRVFLLRHILSVDPFPEVYGGVLHS